MGMIPPQDRQEAADRAKQALELLLENLSVLPMEKVVIRRVVLPVFPSFAGEMMQLAQERVPDDSILVASQILITNLVCEVVRTIAPPEKWEAIAREMMGDIRKGALQALRAGR